MPEDLPETITEEFRRKLSNHSSRLEHGDRRFSEIEIDLKSIKAERRPDWKIWLTIIAMTAGFLVFSREFVHDVVAQSIQPLIKDIDGNSADIQRLEKGLAVMDATEWNRPLQTEYEKNIDHRFAELRTLITDLKNSAKQ